MEQEARARFALARVHVEQGRFVEAAAEFEEAYRLSARPELLYNMFVAYRDAGRLEEAASALRRYLDATGPELDGRAMLEARLASLEQQIAAQAPREAPPPDSPSPAPWIVLGIGAAIGAGAIVTGAIAFAIHDSLSSECPGGVCDASLMADAELGRALTITTDVLWPIAAIAGGIGLVWGIVEASSGPSETAVRCSPLGCRGTF